MTTWEYKVVPAPTKGVKARGVKGPEGRFAHALEVLMNDMSQEGWEYQRAETLPSVERSGLTGSSTEWRNILVFRRVQVSPLDAFEPELLPAPTPPVITPDTPEVTSTAAEAEPEAVQSGDEPTVEDEKTIDESRNKS
jgi:hypothetical protein